MSTAYRSREQDRAQHAWDTVQNVKSRQSEGSRFGIEAKKMPVRILTSGLGPALAFLAAKGYAKTLQEALNDWITKKCRWAEQATETTPADATLMERIVSGDAEFLRLATDECMAYLQWLVRFAEAEGLLKDSDQVS